MMMMMMMMRCLRLGLKVKMVLPPTPLVLVCSGILVCHTCCQQVSSSCDGKTQQSITSRLTWLLLAPLRDSSFGPRTTGSRGPRGAPSRDGVVGVDVGGGRPRPLPVAALQPRGSRRDPGEVFPGGCPLSRALTPASSTSEVERGGFRQETPPLTVVGLGLLGVVVAGLLHGF